MTSIETEKLICLFGNFLPSLPESVDGAVDECGADL